MITGGVVLCGPLIVLFIAAGTQGGIFGSFATFPSGVPDNLLMLQTRLDTAPKLSEMVCTSLIMAFGVALLTTVLSFLTAFAVTQFTLSFARAVFALTLLTLFFPVEARMLPTFDVINALGVVDTYAGLVLPVLPLALGTFYLCQHLKVLPSELAEAARIDGAGPLKFMVDIALPLSLRPLGVVFAISFIFGWNQYLWPLIASVGDVHVPLTRALFMVNPASGAGALLAAATVLPPLLVLLALLRAFRMPPPD